MSFNKFLFIFLFGFLTVFCGPVFSDDYEDWFRGLPRGDGHFAYSSWPINDFGQVNVGMFDKEDYQRVIDNIKNRDAVKITWYGNLTVGEVTFLSKTLYAHFENNPGSKLYPNFKKIVYSPQFLHKLFNVKRSEPDPDLGYRDYLISNPLYASALVSSGMFRNDKEVFLSAIKSRDRSYHNIPYSIGDALKKDRDVILAALNKNTHVFRVMDPKFRQDKDIVLAALRSRSGFGFDFENEKIDPKLRDNREVAWEAVHYIPGNLAFVSDRLKDDKALVLEALNEMGDPSYRADLKYVSERLRGDRDVVLAAIELDGVGWLRSHSLEYASDLLKNDKPLVLKAVHNDWSNFEFASDLLKDDKDIVLAAITSPKKHNYDEMALSYEALSFASDRLKKDKEFAILVVQTHPSTFIYLDALLRTDNDISKWKNPTIWMRLMRAIR